MRAFMVLSLIAIVRGGIVPLSTDGGYSYGTHFSGLNGFPDSGNIHISTVGDFLSGHPRFTGLSALNAGSLLVNDGFTTGSTGFTGTTGFVGSNDFNTGSTHFTGIGTGGIGITGIGTGGIGTGIGIGTGGIHTTSVHGGAPIITKEFYIHSAPDELEEPIHKVIDLGPSHKNYRVVFIKAPGYNHGAAKISVLQHPNEDKTVIYVLAKKPDASHIEADVQTAHDVHSKPEVFFIKYKTQEEALEAQRRIQAQYDALGGTSRVSDEGVAPVTSVIGSLGGIGHSTHIGTTSLNQNVVALDGGSHTLAIHDEGTAIAETSDKYLPPSKKK